MSDTPMTEMTTGARITDRIAEVLREHRKWWTVQSGVATCTGSGCGWSRFGTITTTTEAHSQHVAGVLVETLGLTPETAVRLDLQNPDRSIVLTEAVDIRSARKGYVPDAEVVDVTRHVTRWERTDA